MTSGSQKAPWSQLDAGGRGCHPPARQKGLEGIGGPGRGSCSPESAGGTAVSRPRATPRWASRRHLKIRKRNILRETRCPLIINWGQGGRPENRVFKANSKSTLLCKQAFAFDEIIFMKKKENFKESGQTKLFLGGGRYGRL